MKAKDLMIGDFYWWEAEGKKYSLQVEGKILGLGNLDIENFEPIPITDEILKNNEFIEINDGSEKWYKKQLAKKYDIVGLEKMERNYWAFACTVFPNLINRIFIKYVHELQHALRLVGLSEIADNLKV